MRQRSSRGRQGEGPAAKPPPGDPVETGLRLLSRRDHSREELRRKLRQRGHETEAIEAAIQRIHNSYALDDQAFARAYVRRRSSAKGPMAIAGELAARGIDRASTEAALAGYGAEEQLQAATHLAHRLYSRQREDLGYRQVLDKIGAKLLRRGFPITIARAACRSLIAGAAGATDD